MLLDGPGLYNRQCVHHRRHPFNLCVNVGNRMCGVVCAVPLPLPPELQLNSGAGLRDGRLLPLLLAVESSSSASGPAHGSSHTKPGMYSNRSGRSNSSSSSVVVVVAAEAVRANTSSRPSAEAEAVRANASNRPPSAGWMYCSSLVT
jgi:hypothetical protein